MKHYEQNSNHCIALGTGDLSFWCCQCDSYINHLTIKPVFKMYQICHFAKFKEKVPKDLVRQYYDDDTDDDDDDKDDYKVFINMDMEIKQTQSTLTNPQNSLLIIDELTATIYLRSHNFALITITQLSRSGESRCFDWKFHSFIEISCGLVSI